MKALLACVAVLLAALAVTVEPARACSCIQPDPWKILPQADGAFVGSLVSRRETDQGPVVLTFSVERRVKGQIGSTVEVTTADNSAACGIEMPVGHRAGLFLVRDGGRWIGHLCWVVEPVDLLAAAALPAPNGRGPAKLFVGGRFGPARTMALDAKGRTLAYGFGGGTPHDLSVCPGSLRVAELAAASDAPGSYYTLTIRELPSLRLIQTRPLKLRHVGPVRCLDARGEQLLAFSGSGPDLETRARLVRVTPSGMTTIWRGLSWHASLTDRYAYITELGGRSSLLAVDIRTGTVQRLAWTPKEAFYLTPNPARTRFASLASTEGVGNPRLMVVDTRRSGQVRTVRVQSAIGDVFWLPDGRLVLLQEPTAIVLDRELQIVSRLRWSAENGALVGLTAFGINRGWRLVAATLPGGPQRIVRRLPGEPKVIVSAAR